MKDELNIQCACGKAVAEIEEAWDAPLELNVDLHWSSDWGGDEVGYPDVLVVGLYTLAANPSISCYMDMETGEWLEAWHDCEEGGE